MIQCRWFLKCFLALRGEERGANIYWTACVCQAFGLLKPYQTINRLQFPLVITHVCRVSSHEALCHLGLRPLDVEPEKAAWSRLRPQPQTQGSSLHCIFNMPWGFLRYRCDVFLWAWHQCFEENESHLSLRCVVPCPAVKTRQDVPRAWLLEVSYFKLETL